MGLRSVPPEQFRAYIERLKRGEVLSRDSQKEAQKRLDQLNALAHLGPARTAMRDLFEIAASDPDTGFERNPFSKQEQRTRELGALLHDLGGFDLMSWACNQFEPNDRSNLDRLWDGVGPWRW